MAPSPDSSGAADSNTPLAKPTWRRAMLSLFTTHPPAKAEQHAQGPTPPTGVQTPPQQTKSWKLLYLDRVSPRWRLPILIALIMLVTVCIVLSAVLSVVLSHETSTAPAAPQQPHGFNPILPPAYPLAVRNPYLSAWIPGGEALQLPRRQAEFWRGQKLGWSVMAQVDDELYSLFGMPNPQGNVTAAVVDGAEYTSTRTDFNLTAGHATFTLSFLSPVFPGTDDASLRQQSLPLSFLTVTARPKSGQPDVKIYSDIGHEWLGAAEAPSDIALSKSTEGSTHMWTWDRESGDVYRENDNMAKWGQVFYASAAQDGSVMTMSFGARDDVRKTFVDKLELGALKADAPKYQGSNNPVSAYAHDLGKISKENKAVFGVGMTRDKAINFYGSDETYFYRAKYPKTEQLVNAVSDAFDALDATQDSCTSLDNKVVSESMQVGGQNYSDITTLSLRQVFGAMDVTIPYKSKDTSQANVWMKEISSNGDIQTLDIIMPASPLFYWLSPGYIRLMLRPIAIYLETGGWPHPWAVHDLGDRGFQDGGYPRAVGHDNGHSESMPLESSGNLLILARMYHKAATNRDEADRFVKDHKKLFTGYATYLERNGLKPENQLSTNDGAGPLPNQTNLAIKAAVGLAAYGAMYDNKTATTSARDMAKKIANKDHGLSSDGSHLTLRYGHDESWTTAFNLYPDVLLGLETFSSDIIDLQSSYYRTLRANATLLHAAFAASSASPHRDNDADAGSDEYHAIGLPIDSRGDYGSSNWMAFAGATAGANAKSAVGESFIDDIHAFLANRLNAVAFCDRFFVMGKNSGMASPGHSTFRARPVVGGHFAFLARTVR
ncbi:glutaminase [Diplodia corticola]|uniref:Glutaminase n=1 Tax=Diplodia corticola TaxID=236234 RepID=A0A1J9QPQ3_9PEZI|nr:glutaminase [Diplodia corticola]OJD30441.1 glutaminase [Diplodia corticola]